MKKIIASLLLVFFVFACDKINHPMQKLPTIYNCIDSTHRVIKTNATTDPTKPKVLLEDFTGHYCPNCPRAGKVAEDLITQYPNRVIVIAHHVSETFAKISKDSTVKFKEDFRNSASTDWDSNNKGFSISAAGLPKGMVNRVSDPNFPQADSKWASLVSTALGKPLQARLDLTSYYDTVKHYISVNVKTTFKTALADSVSLVLVLTQDKIVACQKDQNPANAPDDRDPDEPQTRLNYEFDHIVIDAINGFQGSLVKGGPIAVNDTASVFSSCYLLNKCFGKDVPWTNKPGPYTAFCFNDNYVNLVAFIYNKRTKEILQAEKVKIK